MLHARFAPSAAHRWLNCTASVDAAEQFSDPPGESAMEGTAAHWLLEQCLTKGGAPSDFVGRSIVVREGTVERVFPVGRDMAADVAIGVDFIRGIAKTPGWSGVEYRVDLSFLELEQFGTCDLWHWSQDGLLTIADFKYGRVDVSPVNNAQLMLYGLGVHTMAVDQKLLRQPIALPTVDAINLVIIQPRSIQPVPRIKRWSTTPDEITALTNLAADRILEANRAPRFVYGEWCKYCPALGACPETQDRMRALTQLMTKADLSPRDAAKIYRHKMLIESVLKKAESTVADALMRNVSLPGLKLVTARKHRQWRDEDLAKQRLVDAVGPKALKPVTPAQADKLGKEAKLVVADLSFTPAGDPEVALESDPRPPYVARTAEKVFAGV